MNITRPCAGCLLALAGALVAQPAAAQEAPSGGAWPPITRSDRLSAAEEAARTPAHVLERMYRVSQLELVLGRLGMERAHDEDVRDYAERLWRDHRLASRRIRAAADDLGHRLPEGPPEAILAPELLGQVEELRGLQGAAFDRGFLEVAARHQDAAIDALTVALLRTDVATLEGLIGKVTPLLRQHHELARILADAQVA